MEHTLAHRPASRPRLNLKVRFGREPFGALTVTNANSVPADCDLRESDEALIRDPWWRDVHKSLRLNPKSSENHDRLKEALLSDASSWGIVAALILTITVPLMFSPPTPQEAWMDSYSDTLVQAFTYIFIACMAMGSLLMIVVIVSASDRYVKILSYAPSRIPYFLQVEPAIAKGVALYACFVPVPARLTYGLFVVGSLAGIFLAHGMVTCVLALAVVVLLYMPLTSAGALVTEIAHRKVHSHAGSGTGSPSLGYYAAGATVSPAPPSA